MLTANWRGQNESTIMFMVESRGKLEDEGTKGATPQVLNIVKPREFVWSSHIAEYGSTG